MKRLSPKRFLRIIFLFILFFSPIIAYPQTDVERATRETDRPVRKIEEKLGRPPEEPAKEKPAEEEAVTEEGEKFFIKKIDLTGCESFSPADFASLTQKYENKELTLADLEALSKEIEQDYLKKGVIAAVFVPPQEIKEGIVKLQVVEARMGKLQIQEHKYFDNKRLSSYWQVREGGILRYDKISASIKMMNKNPDRQVKAALRAGKKPGTTDTILTAKTRFPAHLTSTFDTEGSVTTGKSRIGLGTRHNNFLGLDDSVITGYTFGREFSGRYVYHSLPLGFRGTSLLYGYSSSESTPKKEFTPSEIKSEVRNTSASLHQDLYKKGDYLGEVYFTFETKDKTVKQNTGTGTPSVPSNRDKLRIFRVGANLSSRGLGTTTSLSPEYSQGIQGLGASPDDNPLASRGTKPSFIKFTLDAAHRRLLPLNMQLNLKAGGQISSRRLAPQEEFSLGGMDSVRGYPYGDYLADTAVFDSAELLMPAFFIPQVIRIPYDKAPLKQQVTPLIFADYGYGERRGALASEKKNVNFLGVGGGLRVRFFDQAFIRLEWGFPVADDTITEAARSRFHFSVDLEDKLPEEIERIMQQITEENIKQWAWELVNRELKDPASPLRKRLDGYVVLAQDLRKQGDLTQARQIYAKVSETGRSVYQQAEDYVRSYVSLYKSLAGYRKQAVEYHRHGRLQQAKEMWQKLADEAAQKPLVLQF